MAKNAIEQAVAERVPKIRAAVKTIVEASIDWSYEVRDELARLPAKERIAFVVYAGTACGHLGDYIAAAGGTP